MNQISGPPNPQEDYKFGTLFDYAVWTPETVITLANVPWNNDYRDIVKFPNGQTGLNAFIEAQASTYTKITEMSYAKFDQPIRIATTFNQANRYNYLRTSNPLQPVQVGGPDIQKDYYYFITSVNYVAPNTTQITVQLDVWSTFGYGVQFGNCYIERGHIGIANSRQMDNFGRDYLTIPEGLDIGGEYVQIAKRNQALMSTDFNDPGIGGKSYDVLVAATVDLKADFGTVDKPLQETSKGGIFSRLPSAVDYIVMPGPLDFPRFVRELSRSPWISRNIVSITAIPKITRYFPGFTYSTAPGIPGTPAPEGGPQTLSTFLYQDWRNSNGILGQIPERYRHLKKFLTYPYMVIEMTTWNGTPIILKPEAWAEADAVIVERANILPPDQRVIYMPRRYNARANSNLEASPRPGNSYDRGAGDDNGEFLDMSTQITGFPTFAMLNDGAIAFLASNMNSLAYQNSSADWSQQRALRGNEVSYDQATAGMNLANDLTGIGIGTDSAQTAQNNQSMGYRAITGAVGGIVGGAAGGAVGGPVGVGIGAASGLGNAAMAGVNYAIDLNQNNASLAIRNSQANRSNAASVGNSGYLRDTNKNLADWAARGDYENNIAGINAKIQDAKLTQPSVSGQVGGQTMNLVHGNMELSVRWKLIDNAAIRNVGEHWLRYGYAVHQFKTPPASLMVMTKFTYWKFLETYLISGPMPEIFKQAIRGMFEKGVTVWNNPNDIGRIDIADNDPLPGVTL